MRSIEHQQVKDVLFQACLHPVAARAEYVLRACAGSETIRAEVESLLEFYAGSEGEDRAPTRSAVRESPRFRPGRLIAGRFRIERLLGRGGMSEVYAARDCVLGVPVAMKIGRGTSSELRARLLEEVRLARRINHPGVCRVYDFGEDDGTPFFTMELIDGDDLATRLAAHGRWPSDAVASLGASLADALAAAHDAGVLHCDLKPRNLLIDRDGVPHLADFGIASLRRRGSSSSSPPRARRYGTPAYMAPEAASGTSELTEKADLYAMGAVLYEVLTGAPPFESPDESTLREMHRSVAPEPPSLRTPGVDSSLQTVILVLLAKDPVARPSSARAVARSLAALHDAMTREASVFARRPSAVPGLLNVVGAG